jgi:hypothetical protein
MVTYTQRVTDDDRVFKALADPSRPFLLDRDQLREGENDELYGGWTKIPSGLKSLLETGERLTTPGSRRFATLLAAPA